MYVYGSLLMNHQNGRIYHQMEDCHKNGRNSAKTMNTTKVNEPTTRLDKVVTRMEHIGASTLHGAAKWQESHPKGVLTHQ